MLVIFGVVAAEATYMQMASGNSRWAYRALCFGAVGAGMVAAAIRLEQDGVISGRRTVALGNASYALYLIHTPVLHGLIALYWKLTKSYPDIFFGSLIVISIIMSLAFYSFFEKPINRWRPRPWRDLDAQMAS